MNGKVKVTCNTPGAGVCPAQRGYLNWSCGESRGIPEFSVRRTPRGVKVTGDMALFQVARALPGDLVLLHPSWGVQRLLRTIGAERAPGLTVVYGRAA